MTRLPVLQRSFRPEPAPQEFLDALEIAEPCQVPWAGMAGDDRVRFCGQCRQNVYNVAAMSRDQAVALIQAAEGRVCLRLTRRADGTVTTADCWTLLRQARRRGWLPFAGMLVVLLWVEIATVVVGIWNLSSVMARRSAATPTNVAPARALPVPPPPRDILMGAPPPAPRYEMGEKAARPPKAKHAHSVVAGGLKR
jgi:hypothetical protein